jgi:hypothetical protein
MSRINSKKFRKIFIRFSPSPGPDQSLSGSILKKQANLSAVFLYIRGLMGAAGA